MVAHFVCRVPRTSDFDSPGESPKLLLCDCKWFTGECGLADFALSVLFVVFVCCVAFVQL